MWVDSSGLKAVGTAARKGTVTVTFLTDPSFVLANVPLLKVTPNGALKGSRVTIRLTCTSAVACRGSGTVRIPQAGTTRTLVLAKGKFALGPGQSRMVTRPLVAAITLANGSSSRGGHKSSNLVASFLATLTGGKASIQHVSLSF